MTIQKFVSPFIPQQLPAFYKEEGPNFVAFLKAYYEWMESTNQAIGHARSLFEYADIDSTEAQFIKYFKNTYIQSLPESIISDKRLLVKHILDLYRSKGTPRGYELLFRMLFNEDIELYIPGDFLFKPSDAEWEIPRYIEVSDNPFLERLVGQQIFNSSRNATAVVESVNQKIVGSKFIHVLYLTSINGRFKFNEKILCAQVPEITLDNAPIVLGSLTAIAIENGGAGFAPGDILDVTGSGVAGKARVAAVRDENGKVQFNLVNGGSGYSLDALVTVATALYLQITDVVGQFGVNETIVSSNTNANGTITSANSSLIQMINFSQNLSFNIGDTVTNGNGATASVVSVIGGGGTGATFSVGGLVNKEIFFVNLDRIVTNELAALALSINLSVSSMVGSFSVGNIATSTNTTANGTVTGANSTYIELSNFSGGLYFFVGDTVTNGSGATAVVTAVDYGANWSFPKNATANLNSTIEETLSFRTIEAGTISFLTNINPGTGYSANPYVDVNEPDIAAERIPDGFGGIKGDNAVVTTNVANAQGIATAVEVVKSGYGFNPGETVFLSKPGNEGVVVTGAAVVELDGNDDGYWRNSKGFLSDVMKIQDSYFYQNFSYEIVVNRMFNVYENIVKDLVHPTGIALFGRFRIKDELISDQSEPEFFSLTPS